MNNYQVSIIVPHYNTPDLLLRLIHSIPIRDDVEVIIVDDNSTVGLDELLLQLKKFTNIKFYKNDSGVKGAGASRNIGVKYATGRWILFADADDFFTEGLYEKISVYLQSDYDIVYFPPTSRDEKTKEPTSRHRLYEKLVNQFYEDPSQKHATEMKYGFCVPWSKLYKRELFEKNKLCFDEIMVSNDIMCMTKCAFYCRKITASNESIYCITRSEGTLTTKKKEDNFDIRVRVQIQRYLFIKEHLSRKEFHNTHVRRRTWGMIKLALRDGFGLRKVWEILVLYYQDKII